MTGSVSFRSVSSVPTDLNASVVKQGSRKEQIASAAQQFEALLLGQLLKSASSDANGGWLGTGDEDQAGMQAMEIAQEQFAGALAARGGLGLAQMVMSQLGKDPGTTK
jgi:Rod binding domain-containing protein